MSDVAPRPFFLHAPEKSGHVPIVVSSPHSGCDYPPRFLAASRLDAHAIRQSEDMFVGELFDGAKAANIALLAATFPRAYVDLNRAPDELEPALFDGDLPDHFGAQSMRAAAGLGTVPRVVAENTPIYSHKIPYADAAERIETIYKPYHECLGNLIDARCARHGFSVLLDAHSMPSQATKLSPRHDVDFVLGNRHGRACAPWLSSFVSDFLTVRGWRVGLNKPYAGGYITEKYGAPLSNRHALQIEINRASYMNEVSYEKHDGFIRLRNDIAGLLAALADTMRAAPSELRGDTDRSAAE
jgi:N-formylglutamate amidohydrolase